MLTIRDLSIGFRRYLGLFRQDEVTRLSDITLNLAPGEVLAVIGSSGSGKSLLAHAVLGLLPPNAILRGAMTFRGQSLIGAYPAGLRGRRIALMPQQVSHLDPLARVERQIAWAARRAGGRAQAAGQLATLGLAPGTGRMFPNQLSGGMARRVLMATATGGTLSASSPGMELLEEGGVITPKRGEYLTFRLYNAWDGAEPTGEWIRTRRVTIKARHPVRDAAQQALDLLPDFLSDLLGDAV